MAGVFTNLTNEGGDVVTELNPCKTSRSTMAKVSRPSTFPLAASAELKNQILHSQAKTAVSTGIQMAPHHRSRNSA